MGITLNVEVRAAKGGKKDLRSLRARSTIPAVVYGGEKAPIMVVLSEKELMAARKKGGVNAIIRLKHAKGEETVIIKELQRHPVTDRPVHADFQRIVLTRKIEARVPLLIVGEAPGVKTSGGMLAIDLRDLHIKALPAAIPQHIDVDISHLELHQNLYVKDLRLPEGVELLDAADHAVVRVIVPKVEEVAAVAVAVPVEGAEAAQPEVASMKGKKDEEGKLVKETGKAAAPAVGDKKESAGKEPAKKEGGKPSR